MKILHIYSDTIDDNDRILISAWREAGENFEFNLQNEPVDYDRLVDLIFECDKVLTW